MNRFIRLRDGSSLDVLGLGVLAIVLATIVFGVVIILPTVSMYQNPPAAPATTRDVAAAKQKYVDSLKWQQAQVAGRSMFYKPLPPDQKEDTTVAAKYYGGPTLLAYVNGTAWFSDGQKVSAKDPDGKNVHFLSAKPPWSVRVRWEGGEFDVKLFDRTEFSSLSSPSALSAANLGGFTPSPSSPKAGSAATDGKPNFPPEARMGPGTGQAGVTPAGGTDAPPPPPSGSPPPPPGGGGSSGGSGAGPGGPPPGATPPSEPGPSPQPAPQPAPQPTPGIVTGLPLVSPVQPSPEAPKEPGVAPEPSKPSHP